MTARFGYTTAHGPMVFLAGNAEASPDELTLLAQIRWCSERGQGCFLADSRERRALVRRRLIRSGPTNPAGLKATSGRRARWYLTDEGSAALDRAIAQDKVRGGSQ